MGAATKETDTTFLTIVNIIDDSIYQEHNFRQNLIQLKSAQKISGINTIQNSTLEKGKLLF